jgi:hypothetical protein
MTKTLKLLISLALVFSAPLAFACEYPAPPRDLPDGNTATKDEMMAGVKSISAYQDNMTTYLACIEADEVVAALALADDDEDGKKQRALMFDKKFNAAVEEQTLAVEEFNAQIRAYKAKPK